MRRKLAHLTNERDNFREHFGQYVRGYRALPFGFSDPPVQPLHLIGQDDASLPIAGPKSTALCRFFDVIPSSSVSRSNVFWRNGSTTIRPDSSRTSTTLSRVKRAAPITDAGILTAALLPDFLTLVLTGPPGFYDVTTEYLNLVTESMTWKTSSLRKFSSAGFQPVRFGWGKIGLAVTNPHRLQACATFSATGGGGADR